MPSFIKSFASNQNRRAPKVSVVIPLYNTENYIQECLRSVLCQRFKDFEVLVVDDGSTDQSARLVREFSDTRVRYIFQENRGLPGARNTGIRHARGEYIAFLDADDRWHPDKLEKHVRHLDGDSEVGVSYSSSVFISADSELIGVYQDPKLNDINPEDIYFMNPVGNGSAPVIRKQALDSIRFSATDNGGVEQWYFNERFRQSEDVECWMRLGLMTDWKFEGLPQRLTYYRVNQNGLSANWAGQLNSWLKMAATINMYNPVFVKQNFGLAKAYQYRYLARRAVMSEDGRAALDLMIKSISSNPLILLKGLRKTAATLSCAIILVTLGKSTFERLYKLVVQNELRGTASKV